MCTIHTQIRRQIVRLANLSVVLLLRRLSSGVAKRFPTYQHLVQVDIDLASYSTKFEHYLPLSLALSLMLWTLWRLDWYDSDQWRWLLLFLLMLKLVSRKTSVITWWQQQQLDNSNLMTDWNFWSHQKTCRSCIGSYFGNRALNSWVRCAFAICAIFLQTCEVGNELISKKNLEVLNLLAGRTSHWKRAGQTGGTSRFDGE